MRLENLHSVYFLGIGGIGMSALARWFFHQGIAVHGYDLTPSLLTAELEAMGMSILYQDEVALLPETMKEMGQKENTMVVLTPAVPAENRLLIHFQQNGYLIHKRSEILGMITSATKAIAVAGTHGKTTTSAMIAHSLHHNGQNISAFVGGIMTNYNTNLIIGQKHALTVVEADEYDRSFLRLSPEIAIITAIDPDHLDIYGTGEEMRKSFLDFVGKINANGQLIVKHGLIDPSEVRSDINVLTYGIGEGDVYADLVRIEGAKFIFNVRGMFKIDEVTIGLPGYHNVENAVASIVVMKLLELDDNDIKQCLASFRGVKRRFEYIINTSDVVYIDDYAHHPAELEALLTSVRALYPAKKITAIFQPHLYSRTRDFVDGFAKSLDLADSIYLLDIYPAREKPMEGVTSQIIFERITNPAKVLTTKAGVVSELAKAHHEVVVTIGAGDIDRLVSSISDLLLKQTAYVDK